MFSRALPEYLAIGMSYVDFYDNHTWLTVAYRKANRIKREQANFDAYIVGAYVYKAILSCAPALNALAKNHNPDPWLDKPFDLFGRDSDQQSNVSKSESQKGTPVGMVWMQTFASAHNKKFNKAVDKESASVNNE